MSFAFILGGTAVVIFSALFTALSAAYKFGPFLEDNPDPMPKQPPQPKKQPVQPSSPQDPITPSQAIYEAAKARLGQHLTLDPSVPAEVGCCEALSVILKDAGYSIPEKGIPGVNAMIEWLLANGFVETTYDNPGTIITAHRPNLNDPAYAHIGCVMQFGVCSNTSASGLWQENYTSVSRWEKSFSTNGSKTRLFRALSPSTPPAPPIA